MSSFSTARHLTTPTSPAKLSLITKSGSSPRACSSTSASADQFGGSTSGLTHLLASAKAARKAKAKCCKPTLDACIHWKMKALRLLAIFISFGMCACHKPSEISLGTLSLIGGKPASIAADIPKSPADQVWQLKFSPRNYDFKSPPGWAEDEMEISIENTSPRTVEFRLPEGLVSVAPGEKRTIFKGKFRELFLLNRSMEGQYAIRTTLKYPVSLSITAIPLAPVSSPISFEVIAFHFIESF